MKSGDILGNIPWRLHNHKRLFRLDILIYELQRYGHNINKEEGNEEEDITLTSTIFVSKLVRRSLYLMEQGWLTTM